MDIKNDDQDDERWQQLSKALFGGNKMADEGLFTYRIMEKIRELDPVAQNLTWHRFLRWAIPILGVGAASLVLAVRAPTSSTSMFMEKAMFGQQLLNEDPLAPIFEDLR